MNRSLFGLPGEPGSRLPVTKLSIPTTEWFSASNLCINAIRETSCPGDEDAHRLFLYQSIRVIRLSP
jgi:hypothetical protein